MLEFKRIEISDFQTYKKYFSNDDELACENSFVNLLVWKNIYNNMLAEYNGQLFIKSGQGAGETFRLPIGNDLKSGIEEIFNFCGRKPRFWAQHGTAFLRFEKEFGQEYVITESRDAFDYIYLQSDLSSLSGKKYHSKRNHINAFGKKFDWHYEDISLDNIKDIKECAEIWYNENTDRWSKYLECEKQGIFTMLDSMDALNIKGGAIFVGKKAVAFTLGTRLNSLIFDIHIEKALKEYAEGYAVINNEFAKRLSDYRYINREDDMGLEGLRKAKLSYKPHILLKKYLCVARTEKNE